WWMLIERVAPQRCFLRSPAARFVESEPQQHDHARTKIYRVRDKLFDQLERQIGEKAFVVSRRRLVLHQKVAPVGRGRVAVVDEVGGKNIVAVGAEHAPD